MGRKRGAALSRGDVLHAAIALVEEHGADALGINRVARALGIQPPSLYHHVASQEELMRQVAIEGWRQLGAALADRPKSAEPRTGIAALARNFRGFVTRHPGWYQLMSTTPLAQADPEFAPVSAAMMRDFAAALAPYGIEGVEVVHAVRMLRATLHGFVLLELGGQFGMPHPAEESFEWLIEHLIAMLERRRQG